MDAGQGAQASAAVGDGGPFVQARQQGGVACEAFGVADGVVDQAQAFVGLFDLLVG
nr:hypothetical protein [Streptomyces sp. ATCC 21386]